MSWNKSGAERAKSFQVYKDLQHEYDVMKRKCDELESRLKEKDETLLRLSRELYQALEGGVVKARPRVTLATELSVPPGQTGLSSVMVKAAKAIKAEPVAVSDLLGPPTAAEPKSRKEG